MKNMDILFKILFAKTFWMQITSLLRDFLSSNVISIGRLKHLGKNSHISPSVKFAYPEHISIGDCSDIGSQTHIYAGMKSKITIGSNTLIGPFVFITSDSFSKSKFELTKPHSGHQADVEIGDNVRIGAHSILLPGIHIGDDVAIGAGSVVTKDIPSGKVAAGNPAKIIKDL